MLKLIYAVSKPRPISILKFNVTNTDTINNGYRKRGYIAKGNLVINLDDVKGIDWGYSFFSQLGVSNIGVHENLVQHPSIYISMLLSYICKF